MSENKESWGIIELYGPARTVIAGRITQPGEHDYLWRIDIPVEDSFRTEFHDGLSIQRICLADEEITRAYIAARSLYIACPENAENRLRLIAIMDQINFR